MAMDLHESPGETAFRAKVRAWLTANLPAKRPEARAGAFEDDDEWFDFMHWWAKQLGRAGYAGLAWPKSYGGGGASMVEQMIFSEEVARADAPFHIDIIGLGMAGPTIMAHGTEAQKQRYLPTILDGSEIWCQLWSEPNAGSDLAAVQTTAVLDGDEWIVTGQKVWTTIAHRARWGLLLARTDPAAAKHAGLTYFIADMRSLGVTIRPLKGMDGAVEFNEVFLDSVVIADSQRIGPVNEGWRVMTTSLMHERVAVGGGTMDYTDNFNDIVHAIKAYGRDGDHLIRQSVASLYVETVALRLLSQRMTTELDAGKDPGPEGSILKLKAAEFNVRLHELGMRVIGSDALLQDTAIAKRFLRSRGGTIEGGTSEIQRNILAERVLGLPREPKPAT
jgi:alkylation response protein AidB-like acyl-CoA dehydrogenase